MMQPTQAGFSDFIFNVMEVPAAALPADSPSIAAAYQIALATVNQALQCAVPMIYALAVYNLGADNLVNWCTDQPGQCYFKGLRKDFKILDFVPGVVSATSDEGSSASLEVPEAFKTLTIGDLQNLKTPWGRQYLAIAQKYGPTIWGLS